MRRLANAFVLAATLAAAGCGGRNSAPSTPRPDARTITREQMLERHHMTAMEAVQALKGNWLVPKGRDSFNAPSQLWVYFDNARLGNLNSLRTLSTRDVSYLRFFDGVQATARWGVGHSAGVILAVSWPGGEPSDSAPQEAVVADTSVRAPGLPAEPAAPPPAVLIPPR